MYWKYSVKAYRETYEHFILPVNIEDLLTEQGVLPPVFKKQRGRPPTKRTRKGAWKRKQNKRSNYHELGQIVGNVGRPQHTMDGDSEPEIENYLFLL